jgi:cytoplasmic tRNA 2-thiolation protein 1
MLEYGDKVAVAVSGGKDSLSLLYILNKIYNRPRFLDIIAVTIDEGIKGYRDESLYIVKRFCSKLKIKNKILGYEDLFGMDMDQAIIRRPTEKLSSCSICGTFRRRAIDLIAESVGANVIATAHNLDDQLQTFMINILSGDTERISWMYPEPIQYDKGNLKKIKPFVEIYEHEIVFYALQRDIPFQSEECPYMHESIRADVRFFLNKLEKDHPGIKYNAFTSMTKISKQLKSITPSTKFRKCLSCGRDAANEVCSVCRNIVTLRGRSNQ